MPLRGEKTSMKDLTSRGAWRKLEHHQRSLSSLDMRDMFAKDPRRADKFSIKYPGMLLDYSKNRVTEETLDLLLSLARECGVTDQIHAQLPHVSE